MKTLILLTLAASVCLVAGCGSKDDAETPKGPAPTINDPNAVQGSGTPAKPETGS